MYLQHLSCLASQILAFFLYFLLPSIFWGTGSLPSESSQFSRPWHPGWHFVPSMPVCWLCQKQLIDPFYNIWNIFETRMEIYGVKLETNLRWDWDEIWSFGHRYYGAGYQSIMEFMIGESELAGGSKNTGVSEQMRLFEQISVSKKTGLSKSTELSE